jgi:hypothetical protein
MRPGWWYVVLFVLIPARSLAQTPPHSAPSHSSAPIAATDSDGDIFASGRLESTKQPPLAAAGAAPNATTSSYGWQILVVDVASGGMLTLGAEAGSSGAALLGVGGYLVGAPLVHASHGNGARALASATLRLGGPFALGLAGFAVGQAICSEESKNHPDVTCPQVASFFGVLGGMVVASLVDAIFIAREPAKRPTSQMVHVAPSVALARSGAHFGLLGEF